MDNYGDNFREGSAYENNDESLFEIQFLDYGSQGTDDEWTPVNTSPNATQGSAIESNFAPGNYGGWADISASPWLYHLFKEERTTDNKLDPRLYWTIGTYETDWEDFEYGNVKDWLLCDWMEQFPNTSESLWKEINTCDYAIWGFDSADSYWNCIEGGVDNDSCV